MRHSGLMVLAFATSCVAVDATEDADFSEAEQAEWNGSSWDPEGETIHVQGGLDPCWAGLCWPSSWPTNTGPGYTGDGGGGGGGGDSGGAQGNDTADPRPIPAPRDCTQEVGHEECYACCDWNVDNVWGARCRRIPKRERAERARCWKEAEQRRADCQRTCPPGPITTLQMGAIEVLP